MSSEERDKRLEEEADRLSFKAENLRARDKRVMAQQEQAVAEDIRSLLADYRSMVKLWNEEMENTAAWKQRAERAEAENEALRAERERGLRLAHELTLDTQTVEEAFTSLVDLVRKARAERDRLRAALSEQAVERYLTERCGWSLEWDGHNTTRTAVVSTLRCFARAALASGEESRAEEPGR